ncbi:MAG: pyridoxamine 5'-phosphate oxidase family protein [Ilyomonas sp.]
MSDVKNLQQQDAIKKLQDLTEEIKVCMFCTYTKEQQMECAPMTTQKTDDTGNIWFISDKNSDRNRDLLQNKNVDLLYAHSGKESFVSVRGTAEIIYDKQVIEEMWSPLAKAWFKEGKDDPNVSIIKVTPAEGKYWDTKNGKMISFLKMIAASVGDKTVNAGVEGKLQM